MKPEQYKAMVEMLITATQNRKLSWNEADGDFYTDIDGCTLWICTNYDFSVNISSYILKLFNDNNVQFETFSLYITFFYYLCIEIQHQGVE